jgi:hypothetical protein
VVSNRLTPGQESVSSPGRLTRRAASCSAQTRVSDQRQRALPPFACRSERPEAAGALRGGAISPGTPGAHLKGRAPLKHSSTKITVTHQLAKGSRIKFETGQLRSFRRQPPALGRMPSAPNVGKRACRPRLCRPLQGLRTRTRSVSESLFGGGDQFAEVVGLVNSPKRAEPGGGLRRPWARRRSPPPSSASRAGRRGGS